MRHRVIVEKAEDVDMGWIADDEMEKLQEFMRGLEKEREEREKEKREMAESLVECFVRKVSGPFKGSYGWVYKIEVSEKDDEEIRCGVVVGADKNGMTVNSKTYFQVENVVKLFGKGDRVLVWNDEEETYWTGGVLGYTCDKEGSLQAVVVNVENGETYDVDLDMIELKMDDGEDGEKEENKVNPLTE